MNYYELVGTYILKGGGRLRTKMLTNLQIMTYIYMYACHKKECGFFHNKDTRLNDVQTGGPRLFHGHIRSVLFCSMKQKRATI
jgi:hypothetical protein